jgi:type III pantothenate kinase
VTAVDSTVDVGNSSIGVGCWSEGRVTVERFREPAQAAARMRGRVALASVAPLRLAALLAALPAGQVERIVQLARPPADLGPEELLATAGADRIAAVLAARPGPAVVVDAGTAVTVEVLDARGRYLGGFIAPGPSATASGAAGSAEQLPRLPGERTAIVPGATTRAALAAGLWGLAVGGVDRLVEAALAALPSSPAPKLLATGGWGSAWAAETRHRGFVVDADLVHRGIARWAAWELERVTG